MSIEQSEKIDLIGIDKKSGEVMLTISDHLDWIDMNSHLVLLQEKLNSYLRFFESGEIYESYPRARGKKVLIEISFKYLPNKLGFSFLNSASEIVKDSGMELRWELVNE